jgi:hypothetical protein
MMMWNLFGPKRTTLSVVKELVEGFDQGTVVFPWPEEEMGEGEEQSLTFDIAPVADGPFLQSSPNTFGITRPSKRRKTGETVRVPGLLVDTESVGEVPGFAPMY